MTTKTNNETNLDLSKLRPEVLEAMYETIHAEWKACQEKVRKSSIYNDHFDARMRMKQLEPQVKVIENAYRLSTGYNLHEVIASR